MVWPRHLRARRPSPVRLLATAAVVVILAIAGMWTPVWLPGQAMFDFSRATVTNPDQSPLLQGDLAVTWSVYQGNSATGEFAVVYRPGLIFVFGGLLTYAGVVRRSRGLTLAGEVTLAAVAALLLTAGVAFREVTPSVAAVVIVGAVVGLRVLSRRRGSAPPAEVN